MLLLIDSANIDDIRRYAGTAGISGVTTNPSLIAKESKRNIDDLVVEIAGLVDHGHLSVEVTTLDPDEMIVQAKRIVDIMKDHPCHLHVKIPVMPETLRVITELSRGSDICVNATACMTFMQARIAANAGADIVSFFFNRMIDWKNNELEAREARQWALHEIGKYCERPNARVICGSIRTPQDVEDCWKHGADYVTAGTKVIDEVLRHPKTVESIQNFQKDIDAWLV